MRSVIWLLVAVCGLGLVAAPPAFAQARLKKQLLPNGTVKSVAAGSVVVTSVGKDVTFAVDGNTQVIGKGVGTKTKSKQGKGSIVDLVKEGDRVTVTYIDAGGTLRASRIEVAARTTAR